MVSGSQINDEERKRRSGEQEKLEMLHLRPPNRARTNPAEVKGREKDIKGPNGLCVYDTVLRHKRHVSLAKEKLWWRPSYLY